MISRLKTVRECRVAISAILYVFKYDLITPRAIQTIKNAQNKIIKLQDKI